LLTNPHQDAIILINRQALGMDDLIFQVFQVGIIKVVSAFESTIGYASLPFQEIGNLSMNFIEGHRCHSARLASAVLYP
jgi:hypothetical protein